MDSKTKRRVTKRIDKYSLLALKIVGISLLILFLIQGLMQFEFVRSVLVPTERWEGRPFLEP
ncbi:hypothetical protein ACFP56_06680 [Paenibacillus septentrionalis]|uniref:Uncharacterized protein n=1 Tax=Paenibacillus septentrionalis TaxID=429342 RepID=A0ABW1V4D4_9BACL